MSADMYVVVPIWRLESWCCRGCSSYVTEPIDVVLLVTGRVLYVYGVVVVVVLGIIMYVTVDGSG